MASKICVFHEIISQGEYTGPDDIRIIFLTVNKQELFGLAADCRKIKEMHSGRVWAQGVGFSTAPSFIVSLCAGYPKITHYCDGSVLIVVVGARKL